MHNNKLKFSQLICSKILHDFAGPVSAISNGVDFLNSDNEKMRFMSQEMIEGSSLKSINLIECYRYVYGSNNLSGEANFEELRNIIINILNNKIQLDIDEKLFVPRKTFVSIKHSKIILGLIICVKNNLLHGGKLNLVIKLDNNINKNFFYIIASGSKIKVDEVKLNILQNSIDKSIQININNIHEYFVRELIDESKSNLTIEADKDSISYKLEL